MVGSGGVAVELAAGPRCSGEATSREDLGRAGGLHRAGARGRQRRRTGIAGGRQVPRRWRPEAGCSPAALQVPAAAGGAERAGSAGGRRGRLSRARAVKGGAGQDGDGRRRLESVLGG